VSWNIKDLESQLLVGSTLVEGSTLSESDAESILQGRTIQGHPVLEIRELLNYRSAVQWIMGELAASPFLSTNLILDFHRRLFQGFPGEHGRFKTASNYTFRSDGSKHAYLKPSEVGEAMRLWVADFNRENKGDAAEQAADLYHRFENIHPFDDGNGRIGRILLAYWLHWKQGRSFTFRLKDKTAHLHALEAANDGDLTKLTAFFRERS